MGAFWAVLGASWARLGTSRNPRSSPRGFQDAQRGFPEAPRGAQKLARSFQEHPKRHSKECIGASSKRFGGLGGILGAYWPSWKLLGGFFGASWAVLGRSKGPLRTPTWCDAGSTLRKILFRGSQGCPHFARKELHITPKAQSQGPGEFHDIYIYILSNLHESHLIQCHIIVISACLILSYRTVSYCIV